MMKCPECKKVMGTVWVGKPSEGNSIYELDGVEYCWKCGNLFLAKPEKIEVRPLESTTKSDENVEEG